MEKAQDAAIKTLPWEEVSERIKKQVGSSGVLAAVVLAAVPGNTPDSMQAGVVIFGATKEVSQKLLESLPTLLPSVGQPFSIPLDFRGGNPH